MSRNGLRGFTIGLSRNGSAVMKRILLTEEMRDGILYFGVWIGVGGSPSSGSFDVDNKLLCLCPYDYKDAIETATAIAEWRKLLVDDLTVKRRADE
jgi:hypothetical protein